MATELFGYPVVSLADLDENTNGWVKNDYVSEHHLHWFPNTRDSYTLFIEGDYPTSDCEGTDCCMVGNTLYWGLHKIEETVLCTENCGLYCNL